jgi:hypothetical protein
MSLRDQTQQILTDFENSSSKQIIQTLDEIKSHFRSELTRNYLKGKIDSISNIHDETEKKKLCKALIPYLDWYLHGID